MNGRLILPFTKKLEVPHSKNLVYILSKAGNDVDYETCIAPLLQFEQGMSVHLFELNQGGDSHFYVDLVE